MSFDDELKELILNAQAASEQRDRELIAFREGWRLKKTDIVRPVLEQALTALENHSRFSAAVKLHNGSIHLKVGPKNDPAQPVTNELIFSPIEEKREISCYYRNPHAVMESFTLDKLDESAVESKVKEFLSVVLG